MKQIFIFYCLIIYFCFKGMVYENDKALIGEPSSIFSSTEIASYISIGTLKNLFLSYFLFQ